MLVSSVSELSRLGVAKAGNENVGEGETKLFGRRAGDASGNGPFEAAALNASQRDGTRAEIAIVDPRSLLRECLVQFVMNHRNFGSAGYSSIEDLISSAASKDIALIILYSANQFRQKTLDEIARLKSQRPTCLIVALVDTSDYGFVRELLQQGARGVIPTAFSANIVLEAISLVLAGGTFVPVESFLAVQQHNALRPLANGTGLTRREDQIVSLVRSGKSNKQIAFDLDLSLGTVKVHLHNIMKKLGAHNRIQVLANQNLATANQLLVNQAR
jgi:DNA-binding NarL/FixJ family response regulator